jgi:hypothetical protein
MLTESQHGTPISRISTRVRRSHGSQHGTPISRISTRDADLTDLNTRRRSHGSQHGTPISRGSTRDADLGFGAVDDKTVTKSPARVEVLTHTDEEELLRLTGILESLHTSVSWASIQMLKPTSTRAGQGVACPRDADARGSQTGRGSSDSRPLPFERFVAIRARLKTRATRVPSEGFVRSASRLKDPCDPRPV